MSEQERNNIQTRHEQQTAKANEIDMQLSSIHGEDIRLMYQDAIWQLAYYKMDEENKRTW